MKSLNSVNLIRANLILEKLQSFHKESKPLTTETSKLSIILRCVYENTII